MLVASVDDEQVTHTRLRPAISRLIMCGQSETELAEVKQQVKQIFRRLSRSSEPQASIESGQYMLQYAFPMASTSKVSYTKS